MTLRLAIVGAGQVSHRYLSQAAGNPRAQFVAIVARSIETARARANEYGVDECFDDYVAMFEAMSPEGVIVATPSVTHAQISIAALERGIPVLCEKPMATTLGDCRAMVAAAQRSGALLLCLPYDATPVYRAALDYLNEETIGVFTGAEAQILLPGHPRANWYYERNMAGGAMLDSLIYPASQLISALGPVVRVTGFVNTLIPHRILDDRTNVESDIDDNATLVVEWATGQLGMLRTLWGTRSVHFESAIYGRKGAVWLSKFGTELIVQSPTPPERGEPVGWGDFDGCYRIPVDMPPNEGLIDHFVDCIEGAAAPTCSGEQQLHVHEVLFKGYEAARTGMAQSLETTFVRWHPIEPSFHDTRTRWA